MFFKFLKETFVGQKNIATTFIILFTPLFFGCDISKESNKNFSWKKIESFSLNPEVEKQIDEIIPKLTLEQKGRSSYPRG